MHLGTGGFACPIQQAETKSSVHNAAKGISSCTKTFIVLGSSEPALQDTKMMMQDKIQATLPWNCARVKTAAMLCFLSTVTISCQFPFDHSPLPYCISNVFITKFSSRVILFPLSLVSQDFGQDKVKENSMFEPLFISTLVESSNLKGVGFRTRNILLSLFLS
jgi:hypothetical protein